MPNPLTRVSLSRSKRPPERPEPIPPVLEEYEGDNIPYRGIEPHGVLADPPDWRDPETDMANHDGRKVIVYEVEEPGPEPIPVRIVRGSDGRERRTFRAIIGYAAGTNTGNARQILGNDDYRVKATIVNTTGAIVYLAEDPSLANPMTGFPLVANGSYQTETQEALYASVAQAADAVLPIAVEGRVELS